jgi:hypothetical protein
MFLEHLDGCKKGKEVAPPQLGVLNNEFSWF